MALLDAVLPVGGGPVAVAISGGPDSTALLHIADHWARRRGRSLLALTVDHRLRVEAAAEAAAVAAAAATLGHPHRTLTWRGEKPATGIQAAARTARLLLLTEACHAAGAEAMLLAHHRDDQVETVLHRIDRGTGPAGLAGMAPISWRHGVRLVRPLLAVAKERLVATCRANGLTYFEDPSNSDPRFTRADLRRMRPALDATGLTVDRLTRLAVAMGAARQRMDEEVRFWLSRHAEIFACGTCRLDRSALSDSRPVFVSAVLNAVLAVAGGPGYPPAAEAMSGLMAWLAKRSPDGRRTLAGCLLDTEGSRLSVMRELAACAPAQTVDAGVTACWDGRFLVRNGTERPVRVGSCGAEGWRRIKRLGLQAAIPAGARSVPHPARLAWPIVTDLDGVVALPHLVLGERRAPGPDEFGVDIHLLATRERRIDGLLANGRLTRE